jgi:hypothetical protein
MEVRVYDLTNGRAIYERDVSFFKEWTIRVWECPVKNILHGFIALQQGTSQLKLIADKIKKENITAVVFSLLCFVTLTNIHVAIVSGLTDFSERQKY